MLFFHFLNLLKKLSADDDAAQCTLDMWNSQKPVVLCEVAGEGWGEVAMKMWHCHGTFLVPANNHAFKDNDALHCDIKFFIDLLTIWMH